MNKAPLVKKVGNHMYRLGYILKTRKEAEKTANKWVRGTFYYKILKVDDPKGEWGVYIGPLRPGASVK